MIDSNDHRGGYRKGAGRKPIPGRVQPLKSVKLYASTQPPRLKCDYTIHLCDKDNHHKNLAINAYCGSWACPRCHEYNKRKWINHIKFMTALKKNDNFIIKDSKFFSRAQVCIVNNEHWESSIKRRFTRQGIDFFRIQLPQDESAVISNGGKGDFLSGDQFNSELEKIFAAVGFGRRPVSASKRWQFVPKRRSRWVRMNILNLTPSQLHDELAKIGLPSEYFISDTEGIVFEYPDSWTEEQILEFARHLASLPGKFK